MASARCFAIQTLRKAVLVIGRTNVEESNALETRVRCDLALLKQDFNKHSLQDQVLILEALEYYQDLPRDMTSILEELHQSLSGPITGSLLEQVKFLRQVLSLREYLLRHAERTLMGDSYRPVKAQLGEILVLLDHRLTKIQEELRGYRSETMEADVVLLDALFDLVIQVEYDRPDDPNAGLEHDIALLLARVEPCAVAQKQDDKDASSNTNTELSPCGSANVKPETSSTFGSTIPADSPAPAPAPVSTDPVVALFQERRLRLEACEKEEFEEEAIAHRTRARARQEALLSDPAKAEQLKHAAKVKAANVEDKRARDNVKKTIEDDRAHMKTKAEQERLARKAVEEQERLAREAEAKDPATEEESDEDDSDEESDLTE